MHFGSFIEYYIAKLTFVLLKRIQCFDNSFRITQTFRTVQCIYQSYLYAGQLHKHKHRHVCNGKIQGDTNMWRLIEVRVSFESLQPM